MLTLWENLIAKRLLRFLSIADFSAIDAQSIPTIADFLFRFLKYDCIRLRSEDDRVSSALSRDLWRSIEKEEWHPFQLSHPKFHLFLTKSAKKVKKIGKKVLPPYLHKHLFEQNIQKYMKMSSQESSSEKEQIGSDSDYYLNGKFSKNTF